MANTNRVSDVAERYAQSIENHPTSNRDAETLIKTLFEDPQSFVFNGARNIEFALLEEGSETAIDEDFAQEVKIFMDGMREFATTKFAGRKKIRVSDPEEVDRSYMPSSTFYELKVTSLNQVGSTLAEIFLAHHKSSLWTLLRRDSVEVKTKLDVPGLGVFVFEYCGGWTTKMKVKASWCDEPISLTISAEEEGPKESQLLFAKTVLANAGFRKTLEQHIFDKYTGIYYAEFLRMSPSDQAEWKENYPEIRASTEIWELLSSFKVEISDDPATFFINCDADFDAEHGFDLVIKDWKIS